MKKLNVLKLGAISLGVGALAVGMSSVSALTPRTGKADIISKLTGKTLEEIINIRTTENKTYGQIAEDNGVLDEFRTENIANTKQVLDERVANGTMTEEQAKTVIDNMENCDGTSQHLNQGLGLGQGARDGSRAGQGARDGSGNGTGRGQGIHRNN